MERPNSSLKLLGDTALWVAGISAGLYAVGSLYTDSYYSRLRVPETALHFDVPHIMMSSLLVLIYPAFWLAVVLGACQIVSRNMPRPASRSPFFPLTTAGALALTLGCYAIARLFA